LYYISVASVVLSQKQFVYILITKIQCRAISHFVIAFDINKTKMKKSIRIDGKTKKGKVFVWFNYFFERLLIVRANTDNRAIPAIMPIAMYVVVIDESDMIGAGVIGAVVDVELSVGFGELVGTVVGVEVGFT
jgi:hypothetical protein